MCARSMCKNHFLIEVLCVCVHHRSKGWWFSWTPVPQPTWRYGDITAELWTMSVVRPIREKVHTVSSVKNVTSGENHVMVQRLMLCVCSFRIMWLPQCVLQWDPQTLSYLLITFYRNLFVFNLMRSTLKPWNAQDSHDFKSLYQRQ